MSDPVAEEVDLRRDARECFLAAVAAVEPEALVRDFLQGFEEVSGEIHLAAFGKAAPAMARGAVAVLGDLLVSGVVISPPGHEKETAQLPERLRSFRGGHPVPNEEGVEGARAMRRLAADLGPDDILLCLISGGGSALMTLPPDDLHLEDVQATTQALLRAGATIGELNGVRKHLDRLKGGRLAREAAPARVMAGILSDVVGDPLDVIASGPVSPDPTTFAEAVEVLQRRGVWGDLSQPVRRHLEAGLQGRIPESPKEGDPCFQKVEAHILGNNRRAAAAALEEARRRGYQPWLLTTSLEGEAREVGKILAAVAREIGDSGQPVQAPACILAAGETTVTVRGSGRGGRNQEVALGAACSLAGLDRVLVASFGTDGIDGPTHAAGALATGTTVARAQDLDLDPEKALAENDACPFFEALDDLIVTGPTGTNVMDLALVLVES